MTVIKRQIYAGNFKTLNNQTHAFSFPYYDKKDRRKGGRFSVGFFICGPCKLVKFVLDSFL